MKSPYFNGNGIFTSFSKELYLDCQEEISFFPTTGGENASFPLNSWIYNMDFPQRVFSFPRFFIQYVFNE